MFRFWHLTIKKLTPVNVLIAALCINAQDVAAIEYIVKLKRNLNFDEIDSLRISSDSQFRITDKVENFNLVKVDADLRHANEDLASVLKDYFDAEYVVENEIMHAFWDSADPRRSEQWALDMVKADDAWGISRGSHQVVVAVIDTGIALTHEDLQSNIWTNPSEIAGNNIDDDGNGFIDDVHGWDFHGNDKDPSDETSARNPGHGTHCSGIIGASCLNGLGVCGMSPTVSLMALRFLGPDGSGDLFASVKAVDYAISNGAHVISASWGATIPESTAQPIIDAIKRAEEKGIVFVAAAANDGKSNDSANVYPANAQTPHMISVAASNNKDEKPYWSNFGRKVDIAAPGDGILSTIPNGYSLLSGTSMATPLISGVVALMKSVDPSLTGAVIKAIIQSTGKDVNIDTASKRRVDAHQALLAVQNKQLTIVPATKTLAAQGELNFSAWGGTAPYTFSSLNPDIATVDESGHLKAIKEGNVVVQVSDANSNKATSVSITIGQSAPPGGGTCPFPDEFMCSIMCAINPSLPWCKDMPLPALPDPFPFPAPPAA